MYAASFYGSERVRMVAVGVAVAAMIVAFSTVLATGEAKQLGHLAGPVFGAGVAWALADRKRNRVAYLDQLEDRARRAEQDREENARRAREEERNRIARDLHDRVAQSLAYLAFELDRITAAAQSRPVNDELENLRHDVRHVVTEVRDTLYDLRTNVSETQDLIQTLDGFLDRVGTRSGLRIRFEHEVVMRRLPVPVERELWRIAEEAITNVERHAKATQVTVVWEVDSGEAHLTILDNGRGFPVGAAGRFDSYGLLGMRERADAIGATLEIESQPGLGTAVRCRMEVP
jgi:signal transduction histidine kinase